MDGAPFETRPDLVLPTDGVAAVVTGTVVDIFSPDVSPNVAATAAGKSDRSLRFQAKHFPRGGVSLLGPVNTNGF